MDIQVVRNFPNFIDQGMASCATTDPEVFFPERGMNVSHNNVVKRICRSCPYVQPCLEWALENREMGIWGATTEMERRKIRRKNRVSN